MEEEGLGLPLLLEKKEKKIMTKILVSSIQWDTDGEKVNLPKEVEYDNPSITVMKNIFEEDYEAVSDALSNDYGFCHFGFDVELVADDDEQDDIMNVISEIRDDIHSSETMEEMAIDEIQEGRYNVAAHLLIAMWEDNADWYKYDRSMGMLETPTAINSADDINDLIEEI